MGNAFEFSQLEKTNNNVITHSKSLLLRDVKPFPDDSRMYALGDVAISLLEKFPNKKDNRGGAVANLIILRDRCTRNHSSSGILNLHLGEEDLAVLGHFDLACAIDQHLEGASWALGIIELKLNPEIRIATHTKVAFHDIGKAHRAGGVHLGHGPRVYTLRAKRQISTHLKGSSPPDTLRLWIDELDTGRHGVKIEGEDAEDER